jgi:hypothetical protein
MRTPEEDLSAALAKVQLSINAIYPAADPAYTVNRSNTLRAAILSFCSDPVAQAVMDLIRNRQNECLPLTDEEVRDYAIRYEEYSHMRPTVNLKFGRSVNNMPVATFIQLNSTDVTANTIYPAYRAYPSGYDNPYPAYQTFEQVRHQNIEHRAPQQDRDNNVHQQQLMHQQQILMQQQQQQQLVQQQQEALVPLNPNNQQVPVHAPPIFGILPLGTPPAVPGLASQQTAKQKHRVDPRLLEEAAARQQTIAEGKIVPQRTVINPDTDWLQGLPQAM